MLEIRTDRLFGRPAKPDDGELARTLFSDPEVGRWTSADRRPWSEQRIAHRTRQFAAHWYAHDWGLRYWFEGDRLVGLCGLQMKVVDGVGAVEASYALLPAYHGNGYAVEAMEAVMREAHEICREVVAVTIEDNYRSQKVLQRLRFKAQGRIVQEGLQHVLYRRAIHPPHETH